jgi:hypothetical protein
MPHFIERHILPLVRINAEPLFEACQTFTIKPLDIVPQAVNLSSIDDSARCYIAAHLISRSL